MRLPNPPRYTVFEGQGTFTSSGRQFQCPFILFRQPNSYGVLIDGPEASDLIGMRYCQLDGCLSDGREVHCDSLFPVSTVVGPKDVGSILVAGHEVNLGSTGLGPVAEAAYPLVNIFDSRFELCHGDWHIATDALGADLTTELNTSKAWRVPVEGVTLVLKGRGRSSAAYDDMARRIALLLSLAVGSGVASHRQIKKWDDGHTLELWRHWVGDECGPGPCLPSFELAEFLRQTLPTLESWDTLKYESLRLAVTNINMSASGYLDNRLQMTMQTWECLANDWSTRRQESEAERSLKHRIRACYKQFVGEHPDIDSDGKLWERLAFAFRWEPALRQVDGLAHSRKLDLSSIGLDLRKLKQVRDDVAHSGSMPTEFFADRDSALKLLHAARFGLQLLLLRELGYTGQVNTEEDKWRTVKPISTFLS